MPTEKYTQHIDCIHRKYLANQGITMCDVGDPSKCDTCPNKESKDIECEMSYTSIEDKKSTQTDSGTSPKDYGTKLLNKRKKKITKWKS